MDLADYLYDQSCDNLPPDALAEVLDRLIWCLKDNGTAICATRERWLLSDDRGRVEVALTMEEVLPFDDTGEMTTAFARICAKWPEFSERCQLIIELRANQNSGTC